MVRFGYVKETVSAIRAVRIEKQIPGKDSLKLLVRSGEETFDLELVPVIVRLCHLSEVGFVSEKMEGSVSFMINTTEFYIPVGDKIDIESERIKILTDLDHYRGFLSAVMKKLDNERFVQNAPAKVLELERKKKSDTDLKIRSLEEALKALE
jgi:valyl-tRNA synthetase